MDNIKQALIVTVGLVILITIASFVITNIRLSDMETRTDELWSDVDDLSLKTIGLATMIEDLINTHCPEGAGSYNLNLIEAREDLNDTLATYLNRLELERSGNDSRLQHNPPPQNDPPPSHDSGPTPNPYDSWVNTKIITQDLLAQVSYLISITGSNVNHEDCDKLLDW